MGTAPSTSKDFKPITLSDIEQAHAAIGSVVKKTPTEFSKSCSERAATEIYLKFENQQLTGSFKMRGAMNKIMHLSPEEKAHGIVASSAGNHAQGVALSATYCHVPSHIVMPVTAPLVKVMATRGYGAEVIQKGDYYDQAYQHARELEQKCGYTFVHPYEDPAIIAGQGTIGLEIIEALPDVDSIIVPIGGGGLISGIATAVKAKRPSCRIYGVQTLAAPSMAESFRCKKLVQVETSVSTIADGVAVKTPSECMYNTYISRLVDDVTTVSEDEIADAIVFLMERTKSVVEGSGALAFAAAMSKRFDLGKKCAIILSGGNIDMNIVAKVIERGLMRSGRLAKVAVAVDDRPGSLSRMAQVIAQKRANIIQVFHDRSSEGLLIGETAIEVILETTSREHLNEIRHALKEVGCRLLS